MRKTVVEHLHEHAKESPDKIAVITREQQISYRRLYFLVQRYASFLKKNGLQKEEVVVVKSSQTIEYAVIYLGIHLAGGVIASAEKNAPTQTLLKIARIGESKIIISDDNTGLPQEIIFINSKRTLEYAEKTEVASLSFPDLEDSADILFTTGTTGESKGVEISHKALVASAENTILGCKYKSDTIVIVPGPLNHASAIRKLITTIVNGSTIYILDGMVNLNAFYDAINYPCEKIACCLPASAIRTIFMLSGEEIGEYADKLDFIESAGASLPETDKEHLCRLLPNTRLYNHYGSSESASVCMYDYNQYTGKKGCVGKVGPNSRILIVDEKRIPIKSSKENPGYIACAGDINMKGYKNEPELTREIMDKGVVYTNDIGYIDEEGFVYIIGRKGDVINVGGMKVAPTEVEEAALSMEGIADCICISVPHPITGEALKLLVVMEDKTKFSRKEILLFLQTKLEGYKVPVQYENVERIARTYNGKLDRNAYRKVTDLL